MLKWHKICRICSAAPHQGAIKIFVLSTRCYPMFFLVRNRIASGTQKRSSSPQQRSRLQSRNKNIRSVSEDASTKMLFERNWREGKETDNNGITITHRVHALWGQVGLATYLTSTFKCTLCCCAKVSTESRVQLVQCAHGIIFLQVSYILCTLFRINPVRLFCPILTSPFSL